MSISIPPNVLVKFSTFGDLLRFLRRRVGMTQMELAIAVGYSDTQISRLEQNLRLPDLPIIEARFITALGLEEEPKAVARLLDLAANVHREDAPALGLCPYKGLNYFDESDADLFVGREALTSRLTERVIALTPSGVANKSRFLAIVGASGSGKSSLVRAGLVPALRWNQTSAHWPIYLLIPTAHPLESLTLSLTQDISSGASTATWIDDLTRDWRSLHLFTERMLEPVGASQLLLIVDQFEEVFALCHSEEERTLFIGNLLTAASEADGPTTIIITLRADFYAYCASYPQLRQALAQNQEYIGAMSDEELRRAIEEPAQRGRWEFEPGLVDLLLHEVGHEPGALPLLSHALLETWQRRRGRMMTMSGYSSSGGVRGAIAETAESVFSDQFNQEQQAIAQRIFLRLTELSNETATADTRRRATFNELILKPEETAATKTVLKALADARLITTSEDAAEVAHEALIREWPTLRGWLEDNRESLRLHRHLTESAQEWLASNREVDVLYRGARLTQVREWAAFHADEMNTLEREFLAASIESSEREAAEREAQRVRELEAAQKLAETQRQRAEEQAQAAKQLNRRARYLGGALLIALIMMLTALFFGDQSRQNAIQAQAANTQAIANFSHAEAQRLAAEATNLMNTKGNSETAALLTLRSLNLEYTPQGDAALLSAINLNYPVQVFTGNKGGVEKVAFSPDDKWILTGSNDHTARLFDAQSGKQLQAFSGHTAGINDIAFSADGKWVLTASWDKTVRLWDTGTGRELRKFVGHTNSVITADFSQDGKRILTGSEDKTLRLWDIENGRELNRWAIDEPVSAFSPDGSYAVGYSEVNNANQLWDIKTLTKTHSISYSGPPNRLPVQFSPNGKYLLASYGEELVLSDAVSGEEIQIFRGHTDGVSGVALSPDGKYVLSAANDRTARFWDIETGQEVQRFSGHATAVYSVAFSSDGRRVLTGGADGMVLLWDIKAHSELPTLNGKDSMFGVAFSPDGKHLATNVISNQLRLWDISTGQVLWSTQDSGLALWALAFSPDGQYLVSGNMDGATTLWETKTGEKVRQFTAQGLDEINALAFSPDRKTMLAGGLTLGSTETFAPLWDVETGREILRIPLPDIVLAVSFSPDGKYILTGGAWDEGVSQLWDAQTRTKLREFTGGVATFSPDGKFIVTVRGPSAFIWDVQSGEEIRRLDGPADGLGFVVYSPDGKTIASPTFDGSVRLWDVQTGQELRRYPHASSVYNLAFSPDGQYLVSVGADGIARFFDVDYHTTIKYLCSILLRDFTDDERAQYNITDDEPTCPAQ